MLLIVNLPFLKRKVGTKNRLLHLAMQMSLATLIRPGGGGQKLDKIKEDEKIGSRGGNYEQLFLKSLPYEGAER